MRVALGTLDISEEDRKKIGKAVTGSSYLKREQAKTWALGLINSEIDRITGASQASATANSAPTPVTAPKDADSLPEPAPANPLATGYVGAGV